MLCVVPLARVRAHGSSTLEGSEGVEGLEGGTRKQGREQDVLLGATPASIVDSDQQPAWHALRLESKTKRQDAVHDRIPHPVEQIKRHKETWRQEEGVLASWRTRGVVELNQSADSDRRSNGWKEGRAGHSPVPDKGTKG